MPTVAVMVAESGMHELPREQISAVAAVRLCETRELLVTLATEGVVDAVISDIRDGAGASVLPAFAEIHRRVPSLPLILYCLPTPEVLRDLPSFIAVTRGLHLVLRNCEHLGLALRPILRATRVPGAGETLARHVVPLVPGPFRPFLLVSALKASPKPQGRHRRRMERSPAAYPGAITPPGSPAERESAPRKLHGSPRRLVARRTGLAGQAGGGRDGLPPYECGRPGAAA
jgi:hypothetical protein